jgi:hypothetical protein
VSDRELLELAAKAAGIDLSAAFWGGRRDGFYWVIEAQPDWVIEARSGRIKSRSGRIEYWNPITDDADALRLAVTLGFAVKINLRAGFSWVKKSISRSEPHNDDPCAATRRAIVRAAAGIERAMRPLDVVHQMLQAEASISYVQGDAETYGFEEQKP